MVLFTVIVPCTFTISSRQLDGDSSDNKLLLRSEESPEDATRTFFFYKEIAYQYKQSQNLYVPYLYLRRNPSAEPTLFPVYSKADVRVPSDGTIAVWTFLGSYLVYA